MGATVNWLRDLQKLDLYISEEEMYELLFSSQQPKVIDFRRYCCNVLFPHVWQQLTNKGKENHDDDITGRDNQIKVFEFTNEKHQQKILRLYKDITVLIADRHVARRGCFDNELCFIKKIAEKFNHITLFNVSTSSLINISDGISFVTQTWRWLTNVMIQTPFTKQV